MMEPTVSNQEIKTSYAKIEQAVRRALAGTLPNDPVLANQLVEDIIDRLDGINDEVFGAMLDEAEKTPLASEEEIKEALKR